MREIHTQREERGKNKYISEVEGRRDVGEEGKERQYFLCTAHLPTTLDGTW